MPLHRRLPKPYERLKPKDDCMSEECGVFGIYCNGSGLDAAEAAYAWFRGRNQPELGGDSIELFGNKYYPVLDPRFSDMETLRAYLNTLFQAEITEALLNREAGGGLPVFTASGGKLYMLGGYAAGGSRALTMRPTALSPASPPSTRTMPPSAASAQA